MSTVHTTPVKPCGTALIPFGIFLLLYLGLSLWAGDFYSVPMPVAFLAAGAAAVAMNRRDPLEKRIDDFASGMGDSNIMLMCLIFILAGAFAAVAKAMGAVDAAVILTRHAVPPRILLPGMFAVSALISLAIGTSCGTIAALTPIALGLTGPLHLEPAVMLGAVIGGAMFGDNLSMISDTTIAATRTQSVAMQEKFRSNFFMVLPAALLAFLLYFFHSHGPGELPAVPPVSWRHVLLILPYVFILILALTGWNVMALLAGGTLLAGAIGLLTGSFSFWNALGVSGKGVLSMAETLIVALLAGGLLALIRQQGGIAWILEKSAGRVKTARGAELCIFFLTSAINLFTANNTVAIVIAGPVAREISEKFRCDPRRVASILDTASCCVQGLIPYGAQILIAVGVAQTAGLPVSTLGLIGALYYPWLMGLSVLAVILFRRRLA